MFIPLDLPPGMFRNGTELQSSGRWRDGSLVRWRDGVLQPVGGWRERVDTEVGTPRGCIAWQDNSGDRWFAFGCYDALTVVSASGTVSDITPGGLTSGTAVAATNTGYGGTFYGTSFYGTPRPDAGRFYEATTWSLSTWGEYLIACNPDDGVIYEWQLNTSNDAAAVSNAPTDCLGAIVTEERFLFALGAGGNPRKVQWSDREDNTAWTPASTNEAGDFELRTTGQIMGAVSTRGQTLIVTDTDVHVANYIGPPFVYGFEAVGSACGAISRKSIVPFEGGAMWMGDDGFYTYRGGDAQRIPCDVADHVFGSLNRNQKSIVHGIANAGSGEIWWFYPSGGTSQCDRYVLFNYEGGHWATGELARSTGADASVFRYPMWMDVSGVIYDHEVGMDHGDASIYAESGPISLGNGDNVMTINQLVPDEGTQGQVQAEIKTRFYPNGDETTFGPYSMANPTDVRLTGRQIRLKIEATGGDDWRWGIPRLNAVQRGRR